MKKRMQQSPRRTIPGPTHGLIVSIALALVLAFDASGSPPPSVWQYTLLPGSQLNDDCLVCGRPTIMTPMQGTFRLRLVDENPLFSNYAMENIAFTAGFPGSFHYKVVGHGRYRIGGEVAIIQEMFLEVYVDDGTTNKLCFFTNFVEAVDRQWPMIHIRLGQTNGTLLQTFTLELDAAPLRQLWFSTANGMTSAHWQPPTNRISPGDLLSFSGRIVKRNQELTQRLGIMPIVPDLGLDAVDVRSSGEILFSIEEDLFSETIGPIQHGDLLSERGQIVARNQDLTRAFSIMPAVPDVGLDAVQVRDDGEIYFSIETDVFSERGGLLRRGDLLSNRGVVVKSNAQLLARFHPPPTVGPLPRDYGLDAVHVWPGGEIWFSLEEGFQDGQLGTVQQGDLLSDRGYIAMRNLDLVAAFAPVEDLADFGLGAMYVLFGATPSLSIRRAGSHLQIEWDAPNAILQETGTDFQWHDAEPAPVSSPYIVPQPARALLFRLREP